MWHFVRTYALILPVFLVIDLTWLGVVMGNFYKSELGALARRTGDSLNPVWWAAAIVYLVIPLGILLFALPRVSAENPFGSALLWGFLYGTTLYAVYDFTNYSLLKDWPLHMTLVDIAWGGVLCAVVTYVAVLVDRWS
jgi:uncharacterized membrane protein